MIETILAIPDQENRFEDALISINESLKLNPLSINDIKNDSDFDKIRDNKEFIKLIEKFED